MMGKTGTKKAGELRGLSKLNAATRRAIYSIGILILLFALFSILQFD